MSSRCWTHSPEAVDRCQSPGTDCWPSQQATPTPSCAMSTWLPCTPAAAPRPKTGWTPRIPVTLWSTRRFGSCHLACRVLVGACALYLKDHSYGEYVFDHAWAHAYQQHGLPYYPKALIAPPFTPVPGARLLARDADASRLALLARAAIGSGASGPPEVVVTAYPVCERCRPACLQAALA